MKIRFYSMLIVAILVISTLIGCGKKELDNSITGNITQKEEIVSETPAPTEIPEPVVFECMDEIKTAVPEDGLVQVDDMLFQYNCKVSELLKKVEDSQCEYILINDYGDQINEKSLIIKNSGTYIHFKKNDDLYFSIWANNPTDDTIILSDCIVEKVIAYKQTKGNAFYSGIYTENNEPVNYYHVKEIMKDYNLVSEKESYEGSEKKIDVLYIAASDVSPSGNLYIYFIFESATGELRSFLISSISQMTLP